MPVDKRHNLIKHKINGSDVLHCHLVIDMDAWLFGSDLDKNYVNVVIHMPGNRAHAQGTAISSHTACVFYSYIYIYNSMSFNSLSHRGAYIHLMHASLPHLGLFGTCILTITGHNKPGKFVHIKHNASFYPYVMSIFLVYSILQEDLHSCVIHHVLCCSGVRACARIHMWSA